MKVAPKKVTHSKKIRTEMATAEAFCKLRIELRMKRETTNSAIRTDEMYIMATLLL